MGGDRIWRTDPWEVVGVGVLDWVSAQISGTDWVSQGYLSFRGLGSICPGTAVETVDCQSGQRTAVTPINDVLPSGAFLMVLELTIRVELEQDTL